MPSLRHDVSEVLSFLNSEPSHFVRACRCAGRRGPSFLFVRQADRCATSLRPAIRDPGGARCGSLSRRLNAGVRFTVADHQWRLRCLSIVWHGCDGLPRLCWCGSVGKKVCHGPPALHNARLRIGSGPRSANPTRMRKIVSGLVALTLGAFTYSATKSKSRRWFSHPRSSHPGSSYPVPCA
jgi:hypothetical protein